MAKVIPGVALPLLVGVNFRDGHAECPDMQRQVNNLNAPKIYFFRDSKALISSITLKHLNGIHRDMDHQDHTQMATECVRLGHKVSKAVELWISRVIQECQVCKDKDRTFSHGHGKKYKTAFKTDILVSREKVIGVYYFTDLFSLELWIQASSWLGM